MKRFQVWYSEEVAGKIGFTANSKEEAEALIGKVESGEILVEDLPGYWNKITSGDYIMEQLTEVGN